MRRVKLTFLPDIERTRVTFPKHTSRSGKESKLARSGKGDLLIRPGQTLAVTTDERDYLRDHHSELLPELLRFSVPATATPQQIEIPDETSVRNIYTGKTETSPICRSRAGAIHVRPGRTLEITPDERDQIKRLAPQVFSQLLPLAKPKKQVSAAHRDTEPPPAPAYTDTD